MPSVPSFATPLGSVALAAGLPLLLLYLIQPDPRELTLPTTRFLATERDEGGTNPVIERLRRNVLLLLQLLVVLLVALALATPYVTTTQAANDRRTVLVVDASASMATETGDGTRFERAIDGARDAVGSPTSIVVAGGTTRTVVEDASSSDARAALDDLHVTDAPTDLGTAIDRAASLAGEDGRVVVFSDFATGEADAATGRAAGGDWTDAVQAARARDVDVSLEQFDGGGTENVGIVDRRFADGRVTFTVQNTGETAAERTLSFADRERSLTLEPGDRRTLSFPVPAEDARARLTPADDFPTDDVAPVVVQADRTTDVLLLTNRESRHLRTALDAVDTVDLTVRNPPVPIEADYDVVLFVGVDRSRVLDSTVQRAGEVLSRGGGVAIQAHPGGEPLGEPLLPVAPAAVRNDTRIGEVAEHPLTRGFEFPPPDRHVAGRVQDGRALVSTADGSPLLATGVRDGGRVLYYGYLPGETAFRYSYRYPVFWKRASHWLADRPSLSALNRQTGTSLQVADGAVVESPTGTRTGRTVRLDAAGTYETADGRVGVSLLRASESAVAAPSIDENRPGVDPGPESATESVRRDLTPLVALALVLALLVELAVLRYRGDV